MKRQWTILAVVLMGLMIVGCSGGSKSKDPGESGEYFKISFGGQTYIYNKGPASIDGTVCGAKNSEQTRTYIFASPSVFTDLPEEGSYCKLIFDEDTIGEYEYNLYLILEGEYVSLEETTLTITQYSAVGGMIKGNFSGNIQGDDKESIEYTGEFSIKREADGGIDFLFPPS